MPCLVAPSVRCPLTRMIESWQKIASDDRRGACELTVNAPPSHRAGKASGALYVRRGVNCEAAVPAPGVDSLGILGVVVKMQKL